MTLKKRADQMVFEQGLAESRSQARALIMAGRILYDNRKVEKAGENWPIDSIFRLKEGRLYVSRGGFKLAGALSDLALNPQGLTAMDIGASTGGFTDCLLQNGATRVTAVDVGKGLLDFRLRNNPKVTVVENLNARYLSLEHQESLGAPFDLIVADVSFISLELILPPLPLFLKPDGQILVMVKPQFEVGRQDVGKGVVKDETLIKAAVDKIAAFGLKLDPPMMEAGRSISKLPGPEGNREVFVLFKKTFHK